MLENLVQFGKEPEFLDATDGLAAAVCHYFQEGRIQTGWQDIQWLEKFHVKDHPDRLK